MSYVVAYKDNLTSSLGTDFKNKPNTTPLGTASRAKLADVLNTIHTNPQLSGTAKSPYIALEL